MISLARTPLDKMALAPEVRRTRLIFSPASATAPTKLKPWLPAARTSREMCIRDSLPGDELPAADCIVNPNLAHCDFPSKHLAGVGVIFYVMLALRAELRARNWFAESSGRGEPRLATLLDLVALGTVADVVRLDHNNRVLVSQGLQRIRQGRLTPGLRAIFRAAGRNPAQALSLIHI